MRYLEILEKRIWRNKLQDNTIHQLLVCEVTRINTILEEASYMDDTEKRDWTYEFEKEYKKRVIELLSKIDIWTQNCD